MTAYTQIEKFITDMAKQGKHVRLTVEYSDATMIYSVRMVDHHYGANIAMLDANDAHYLIASDKSLEVAMAEMADILEMQYC